ncbi:hypothetical protein J5N97_024630 [Dioscorea zingiberensis]|uniref:RNA helicase n=1 Tax=Dioscorea zingiberensis TaxID=325984 RepID=A0A9D5H983_9LILI|nr:hypothetical protein J5N97_024630 [Dioscorea zingiberensis]
MVGSHNAKRPDGKQDGEEDEEEVSFEELGLDPRLIRALAKKSINKPTPIQREGIPLILEGKDVVARAKTGCGKTYAYLLPMLQKLFSEIGSKNSAPSAFILVPTRELCQQVYSVALSLLEFCRVQLKVALVTTDLPMADMSAALAGPPDLLVSTPACISTCISKGVLSKESIQESLSMLVLDEADLLLDYGYKDDLEGLKNHISRRCQCLLMSATLSSDVEILKKLVLHNPVTLTLSEAGDSNGQLIPKTVQQFLISCSSKDKLLYTLALLRLEVVQKKILIFVNTIDMGYRLRLFLEQFGIKSAILNAELPHNSRNHILHEFNVGLFDYLIATDDNHLKEKEQTNREKPVSKGSKKKLRQKLDSEFGVVRGIDFKNVFTVLNFDMPQSPAGYVHRIGRTGRAQNTGASISLVSPEETEVLEGIKQLMGEDDNQDSASSITPFPLLTKNAVESLRYRAEDVAKGVTKVAIRESRARDLRDEITNSEKLKAHFDDNPRELDLLKHDKFLSKKAPPAHLREVPVYLRDHATEEASKNVKLSRAAMGIDKLNKQQGSRRGFGRFGKSRDPLKTFSAEGKKLRKRKDKDETTGNKKRRKNSKQEV